MKWHHYLSERVPYSLSRCVENISLSALSQSQPTPLTKQNIPLGAILLRAIWWSKISINLELKIAERFSNLRLKSGLLKKLFYLILALNGGAELKKIGLLPPLL
jgi:hypothetical protein